MDKLLCGVDLGGTKLSVGLVKRDGTVVALKTVYDHTERRPDDIVSLMVEMITDVCRQKGLEPDQLHSVGVGSAGHIRHSDGVMITMSNIPGFAGYPLRQMLQERLPVPVVIDNDANAQAYAEYRLGAGRGRDPMLFMTVSTQIGAGIVLGGQLFRGRVGTAGEFGHTIIDPNSEDVCPCGNKGCLIALASGVAIPRTLARKVAAGIPSPWSAQEPARAAHADGPFILEGLAKGDPACRAVVDEFADHLGVGLYNLFQIFNPEAVVIGGGLTHWGDALFDPMRARFTALAGKMLYEPMAIVPGTVDNSGVVGAALLGDA